MSDLRECSLGRMQFASSETERIWKLLTAEQKVIASDSLSFYCQPVEFYNYLKRYADEYPSFLQRCLDYKIKVKHKKRVLMTVSLLLEKDEIQSMFPLCFCLGRLDLNEESTGEEKYHVGQMFTFQGPSAVDENENNHVRVNFMLPEHEKLAVETNYDKYFILIFASAENPISLSTINANTSPVEVVSNESSDGEKCLYGKVSLKFLYEILKMSPNSSSRQRTEILLSIDYPSCIMKYCLQYCTRTKSRTISIQDSNDSEIEGKLKPHQISIGFEEFGAAREPPPPRRKRKRRGEASSSSSLSHISWLPGNVAFTYSYFRKRMYKIEVTENFTCPICLVRCASYKGLKCHLPASHEILNFEFPESEAYPAVYVSPKNLDWKPKPVDPRADTFQYCAKKGKRKSLKPPKRNVTDKPILDGELPPVDAQPLENAETNAAVTGQDSVPSISDSDNGSRGMQQVDHEEVSKAISYPGSTISDADGTLATLEVQREEVANAILHTGQEYVPEISDHDNGQRAVLEVDHEGVSNAIVLHTGQDCVPPVAYPEDGTRAVLEDDHEGVSNAIVLHTGQDSIPPVADHEDGTRAGLEDDHEGVSNAIVLHTGQDSVPPVADPEDGTRAGLEDDHEGVSNAIVLHTGQDSVPPVADPEDVTPAVLEDHHEGVVSNAIILHPGVDSAPSRPEHDEGTSSVPQVEEKEQLLIEMFDPILLARWKKRKFYHSHKYQLMALEEVLLDEDSEDEINEGAQEIEYNRKLALLNLPEHEKRFIQLWSKFVKKQRVLADGHVSWACEAFTKYHGPELAQNPALAWSWRLYMIRLCNMGLLKPMGMHACSLILEEFIRKK